MQGKRYQGILFLTAIVIIMIYVLVFEISSIPVSITGQTAEYIVGSNQPSSIHEFLTMVRNHPGGYMVVLGQYAKDYEIIYGEKIAEYLGIIVRYGENIESTDKLVLIGSPNTNLLLDKFLRRGYSKDEAVLSLAGNNLLVIVSDEQQAKKIYGIIANFREMHDKLSPDIAVFGFGKIVVYIVGLFLLLVGMLLFLVESYRKKSIARAQESKDEHKLEALQNYIKKYKKQGYSEEQIRRWLVNYDYNEELVMAAFEGLKNAGANISH